MLSSQVKPKAGVLCYRTKSFMTVERPSGKNESSQGNGSKGKMTSPEPSIVLQLGPHSLHKDDLMSVVNLHLARVLSFYS